MDQVSAAMPPMMTEPAMLETVAGKEAAAVAEPDVIRLAIGHYRGRMTEVARRLGIGRSTLYRKLGELGMGDVAA